MVFMCIFIWMFVCSLFTWVFNKVLAATMLMYDFFFNIVYTHIYELFFHICGFFEYAWTFLGLIYEFNMYLFVT